MNPTSIPPAWKLPEGVNASLWEYTHHPRLALDEEEYFQGHPMFVADAEAIDVRFVDRGALVDLGCGTGRHALRFARRAFPVVAIDLSHAMLRVVRQKAAAEGLPLLALQANLCHLESLRGASFDYALSMFSTLGMVRGRHARRRVLAETYRLLRPSGRLALHAHNLWLNLRDSQGRSWLREQAWRFLSRRPDAGDRRMTYRGIAGMEVHLYRWSELRRELRGAGFRIDEVIPIDEVESRPIRWPRLGHSLRAGGWLVFARRPG